MFKNKKEVNLSTKRNIFESIELDYLPPDKNKVIIDINTTEYEYLRKPVNDFLYKYLEHSKNVIVFKLINSSESYLISGIKNFQKIIVTHC